MADENETLEESASTEVEQPEVDQTVETASESEGSQEGGAEGASEEVTPKLETPRKYAGKYATVEDLEEAYQRSNAEGTRMAQQLAQLAQPQKTETKTEPEFTPSQLEDFKEGRLVELGQAQSLASRAYAEGNVAEAQRYEQVAKESARQIRMIDAKLRKIEIEQFSGSQKKIAATDRLRNDAKQVIVQYADQLVEGTEFHTKASDILSNMLEMGHENNEHTQAMAVSFAAQVLGVQSKGVAVNTRKELTKTISKALKDGVASGAGKAGKGGGNIDFMKMSDKEFREFKAKKGWD